MTVFESLSGRSLPEYYDGMYLDGYKPYEILQAAHNTMLDRYEEQSEAPQPMKVKFQVEVKKK